MIEDQGLDTRDVEKDLSATMDILVKLIFQMEIGKSMHVHLWKDYFNLAYTFVLLNFYQAHAPSTVIM